MKPIGKNIICIAGLLIICSILVLCAFGYHMKKVPHVLFVHPESVPTRDVLDLRIYPDLVRRSDDFKGYQVIEAFSSSPDQVFLKEKAPSREMRLTSVSVGCQIDPHAPDTLALRLKQGDGRNHFDENPCAQVDWGIPF